MSELEGDFKSEEERQAARDMEIKKREAQAGRMNRRNLRHMEHFIDREVIENNIPGVANATESDAARQIGTELKEVNDLKIDNTEVDVARQDAIAEERLRKERVGFDPSK